MNCPHCGAWALIIDSRMKEDNSRRRRYECANLHRFTTLEQVVKTKKQGEKNERR